MAQARAEGVTEGAHCVCKWIASVPVMVCGYGCKTGKGDMMIADHTH